MIKEKKKKSSKYYYEKTKAQLFIEYARTVFFSFLVALFISIGLTINARNEMIRDIISMPQEQSEADRKLAIEIITQTDLIKDLKNKNAQVCMHAGEIYETAGDYPNAQRAYEFAIEKQKVINYTPYFSLIRVLVAQQKFDLADALLENIDDKPDKKLIKFKARSYITIGDKYYSIGKFLSAAKKYEKAYFYYDKFSKKDSVVEKSIKNRIVNSYIEVADLMVKSGLNSEAVRFLKFAEALSPDNFNIRYKLAIILSDLDPEKSVEYIELLMNEAPQDIDYNVYNTALMKAANIADLDGRATQAKYYRYKLHSIDLFIARKVIYKNDIEVRLQDFKIKKTFFRYPLKLSYEFLNVSSSNIPNLNADFVLCLKDKPVETVSKTIANKEKPLYGYAEKPFNIDVLFNKNIFTKKEFENYSVKIYLYKDKKFKTYIGESVLSHFK